MPEAKTRPEGTDPDAFLAALSPAGRRADAMRLDTIFRTVTGFAPEVWTGGMVGYGRYSYTYATGHSGTSLATGFAPRKASMVLYIMPGYANFADILADLGPHRTGKSCLYLPRLAKIDEATLARLIRAGLDDLGRRWTVVPT